MTPMPKLLLAFGLAAAALPAVAVEVGDTYEQVIAEKGAGGSKITRGDLVILNYPDETIRLSGGKVVAVKANSKVVSAVTTKEPRVEAGQWLTDYPAALARAKAEKRLTLLLFTGSDWCVWCKRLDQEILSTREFGAFARERLVLVKLDFPQSLPQTPQLKAQNQRLATQYKVDGYPTVIVLNSAGAPVATLGYEEGGPQPFLEKLKRL
jgi:thioredoxin-related protein